MITSDDIAAFTADDLAAVEALDRVAGRMAAGRVQFKEASAQEFPQIVRAGMLWKEIALHFLRAEQERTRSAMGVFDRHGRETS